jgi:2',3'-cyclic-nucleotide 2'-phosphodiesterase (5'-nucleotidase family)
LFFQGSVWYSLLKWSVVANMTLSLGYTASSLGNHEFDDGVGDLTKFAAEVTGSYPLLACNLVRTRICIENARLGELNPGSFGFRLFSHR